MYIYLYHQLSEISVDSRPLPNYLNSYCHLLVVTGYFYGLIHSMNGVLLVLISGILGNNCNCYPVFLGF